MRRMWARACAFLRRPLVVSGKKIEISMWIGIRIRWQTVWLARIVLVCSGAMKTMSMESSRVQANGAPKTRQAQVLSGADRHQ